ncbi:InlB B-repeat-containing protein, partial [Flavonifractor hominis]
MKKAWSRLLSLTLAATLSASLSVPGMAAEMTEQSGQHAVGAVRDAYVESGKADQNFGQADTVRVKLTPSATTKRETLLTFDLAQMEPEEIQSAILSMQVTNGSTNVTAATRQQYVRIAVNEIPDTWEETEVTWNNSRDLERTYITTADVYAVPGETFEADLTDFIQDKLAEGITRFSLLLESQVSHDGILVDFSSREGASAPQLIFNQERPAGEEDGHELWLRYDPDSVDAAMLAEYQQQVTQLVCDESCEDGILASALAELQLGTSGLFGLEEPMQLQSAVTKDGAVVFGTADSPQIQALGLDLSGLGREGYLLCSKTIDGHSATVIAANTPNGVLYGVFQFLARMQTGKSLKDLSIQDVPVNDYRMLNHWDNANMTIERGYAGLSIWDWNQLPELKPEYTEYARACASVGINGVALNNVNADAAFISEAYLPKIQALADVFRDYGIQVYLSLNFGSPNKEGVGKLEDYPSADDAWAAMQEWWTDKFSEIYSYIPDLGGFLIKADAEGQPGPFSYGKNHADGANMLSDALAASGHDGLIIWRAFVYGDIPDKNPDRVAQAYETFQPIDGQFNDNVVIQIKNGPLDFQVREPVHPLFGGLKQTNVGLEVQVTQEYTGQDVHNCYLVPLYKEVFDFDTYAYGEGSTVANLLSGSVGANKISLVAGVANTGSFTNWTNLHLAQANWYGFGRLAWDPDTAQEDITTDFVKMTFGCEEQVLTTISQILTDSRAIYESYTSPLGLGLVSDGGHFSPNPAGRQSYHKADSEGVGYDRVTGDASDRLYVDQYYPENTQRYRDLETCPEELLLWFHHVPYDYQLNNGETVLERLYSSYSNGPALVQEQIDKWSALEGKIDARRFREVLEKMQQQKAEAQKWADAYIAYFEELSGVPCMANQAEALLTGLQERMDAVEPGYGVGQVPAQYRMAAQEAVDALKALVEAGVTGQKELYECYHAAEAQVADMEARVKAPLYQANLGAAALTLTPGQSVRIPVAVTPDDADHQLAELSLDQAGIIEITEREDDFVTLKASAAGTAVLTLRANDGLLQSKCTITVADSAPTYASQVQLPEEQSLTMGTRTPVVPVLTGEGCDQSLVWSVDQPDVVQVALSEKGEVELIPCGIGTATVTATTPDGSAQDAMSITVDSGAADEQLLSRGKSATASSYQNADHVVEKALDGDMSTYWGGNTSSNEWFIIDLGELCQLSRFEANWLTKDNRYYQYYVEASTDGEHYTEICDHRNNTQSGLVSDTLDGIMARYIRIYVTKSSKGLVAVNEFEVYGSVVSLPLLNAAHRYLSPEDQMTLRTWDGSSVIQWSVEQGETVIALSEEKDTSVAVTALTEGEAVVRAEWANGLEAFCRITVGNYDAQITGMCPLDPVTVPQGTELSQAAPQTVTVYTADGQTYACPVVWEEDTYNPDLPGTYLISGTLAPEQSVQNPYQRTAQLSIHVAQAPEQYTVTVTTQGEGEASATPTAAAEGDTVTLTAQAAEGWHFVKWTSEDVTVSGDNTFQMPAKDVTITAVFEQDTPVVTGVTVSPDTASVQVGTTRQFNAVVTGENEPSQAVTWSVEGTENPGTTISDDGLLTVAEDETAETLTVTATSVADGEFSGTAAVTVTAAPVETYTLTVNGGTGSGEYEAGAQITVTANTPEEGMQFVNWTADGLKLEDNTATTLTITMPANAVTLTANYEAIPV